MKKNILLSSLSVFVILLMSLSCALSGDEGDSEDEGTTLTDVVFQSAVQTGGTSEEANSTGLTLTFDVDPSTLEAANITVTGATRGSLTGSGKTRSLAISGITVGNDETVSVAITNPGGFAISGSPKTATVYREPYIGMAYQGGIIAYILQDGDPGYDADTTHGLIAATEDQSTGIAWITGGTLESTSPDIYSTQTTLNGGTSTDFGNGQANTTAMMDQTDYEGGAAQVCDGYTIGIYSDWYLPSKDELNKLYINKTAIGSFDGSYWSSSEYGAPTAWTQIFSIGGQGANNKYFPGYRVRAVRSF